MTPHTKIVISFRITLTVLHLGCVYATLTLPSPYYLIPLPIFLATAGILSKLTQRAISKDKDI